MNSMSTTTDPRILQNVALAAVVMFGLLMSYMIHVTQQTVASVQANQHLSMEEALTGISPTATATPRSN